MRCCCTLRCCLGALLRLHDAEQGLRCLQPWLWCHHSPSWHGDTGDTMRLQSPLKRVETFTAPHAEMYLLDETSKLGILQLPSQQPSAEGCTRATIVQFAQHIQR